MSKKKAIIVTPVGLDIKPEDVFSQDNLIDRSKGRLLQRGVCNGLIMKRAIEHIDLQYPTPLEQFNRNILNKFDDFVETTNLYQTRLQTHKVTDAKESRIASARIQDGTFIDNLPDNIKSSNIIGFSFSGLEAGHIISITLIRDQK